ncbi:copper(I)-binding protein [Bradyrhizobium sp. GM0.4]|jgi:copper(I)-binding protein
MVTLYARLRGRPAFRMPMLTAAESDRKNAGPFLARSIEKEAINMKNIGRTLLAISLLLTACAVAQAEDIKAGDLVISQPWSRATPGGAKVAGGYLTIENKGTVADKLVSVSADIAGKAEVHEMAMENGVMKMRLLDKGLVIDPGKTVKFAPGGYHLMLQELKGPFKQGDKVPVTLQFEKAGKVAVSLDVQGVGAQAPGDSGHMMKKMPDHSGMKM